MHLNHLSYCFSIDNAHFRVSMLSDGVINFVIPGHSHAKGCYEIHCITDGNGSILLNNTRFPVAAGSIYVTGPHIFHEQTPDHAHPMTEMCVYMQLIASPDQHDDTLFDKHLVQSFLQQTCWIGTDTTGILPIMKQIFSEAAMPALVGHQAYMSGLFMQLFCLLVRCYQTNPNTPAMPQQQRQITLNKAAQDKTNLLQNAMSPLAIEEAFLNNYKSITLSDLAAVSHISTRQLQRMIQKQYGTTFQKKRTQARISAACILLKTTSYSLSEIAEQTGYLSLIHISEPTRH